MNEVINEFKNRIDQIVRYTASPSSTSLSDYSERLSTYPDRLKSFLDQAAAIGNSYLEKELPDIDKAELKKELDEYIRKASAHIF